MSVRRSVQDFEKIPKERNRCISCICVSWKVFTRIISHVTLVTLVVAYCLLGATTFKYLESENEMSVKRNISFHRKHLTENLWKMTYKEILYLEEENWTATAIRKLKLFENEILDLMKTKGWDGIEDMNNTQWTFPGSLFYSIIVITTIGYGHIAPKTPMGKVTTIFYAILGIPLMLLCLSTIGDLMASSLRFLYWRVCCFICTREPKRKNSNRLRRQETLRRQNTIRQSVRHSTKSAPSMRRSMRVSTRTADSGLGSLQDRRMSHAYSDTELRYSAPNDLKHNLPDRGSKSLQNRTPRFINRMKHRQQPPERHTVERERNIKKHPHDKHVFDFENPNRMEPPHSTSHRYQRAQSLNVPYRHSIDIGPMTLPASFGRHNKSRPTVPRSKSLDPRSISQHPLVFDFDDMAQCDTPILFNKYAIMELERELSQPRRNPPGPLDVDDDDDDDDDDIFNTNHQPNYRSHSMPRHQFERERSPGRAGRSHQSMTVERHRPHHHHQPVQPVKHLSRQSNDRYLDPHRSENGSGRRGGDGPVSRLDVEMQPVKKLSPKRKERPQRPPPSPRIMSPLGFAVHRQARMQEYSDDDSMGGDDWDWDNSDIPVRARPVPIWLCVFLVVSYIIAGAFIFHHWERWSPLDSAYFCFITLTTIGFGDFVPAQGVKEDPEIKIALCSLYLLFGIALLAMSFNLVQEEVIANVKNVARRLGIIKEEEVED